MIAFVNFGRKFREFLTDVIRDLDKHSSVSSNEVYPTSRNEFVSLFRSDVRILYGRARYISSGRLDLSISRYVSVRSTSIVNNCPSYIRAAIITRSTKMSYAPPAMVGGGM